MPPQAAARCGVRDALRPFLTAAIACVSLVEPDLGAAQDAVVLSGGGSRGLAHAGALAGIEQRGYGPGLVVGTSMGSIIGALYASGYSTDSIIRFARTEDWAGLFTPMPLALGEDRAPRQPIAELRVGGGDARTATGFITDTRINRRLVRTLFDAGARARGDFDRLPRRYRAIAVDMRTGDPVAIRSGDLALAVRSSMSVPGVFAPIVESGRVLADGGVASYLPVGITRELGGRRIIAVDVLRPARELESTDPLALGFRAFRLTLLNTLEVSDSPTFLITPRIPQRFSAAYFPRRPDRLIAAGRSAALSTLPESSTPAPAPASPASPPTTFSKLVIESSDTALAELVRSAVEAISLERYDTSAVYRAVDRIYATGLFAGVWPSVQAAADSGAVLEVRADAAARTRVAGAVGYDNDRSARVWTAIRYRRASRPVELAAMGSYGTLDARASIEARGVSTNVPALAWTAGAEFRDIDVRRFQEDDIVGERDVARIGAWLGLEWRSLAPDFVAAATLRADHVQDEDGNDGAALGPALRFEATGNPARTVGMPLRIEAEARFGDVAYQRARLSGSIDGELGKFLVAAASHLSAADDDAPPDALYALGDEHFVPGLRWGEERARAIVAGGFDVAYPIVASGYLRLRLRAGYAADSIDDVERSDGWVAGAGVAGVWHLVVGPVEAGVAVTDRGDWRLELNLGPVF